MSLTAQLVHDVEPDVQYQGRQYYIRGVVRIREGTSDHVDATVHGTQPYEVGLVRLRDTVLGWCSCPYCQNHWRPCKHIFATLLAADARGYLRGPTNTAPQSLEVSDDADPASWEDVDWEATRRREWVEEGPARRSSGRSRSAAPRKPPRPSWKKALDRLDDQMRQEHLPRHESWPPGHEILYVVDVEGTLAGRGLLVEVAQRQRKKNGDWTKPKAQRLLVTQIPTLPDPRDREILSFLTGAKEQVAFPGYSYYSSYAYSSYESAPAKYHVPQGSQEALLQRMCATGRCLLRRSAEETELASLQWEEKRWEFWLEMVPDAAGKNYLVRGSLRHGEERRDLAEPVLVLRGGLVFWLDRVAPLEDFGAFDWMVLLRKENALPVPAAQKDRFLEQLFRLPNLPRLDLPSDLAVAEVDGVPHPRLKVKPPRSRPYAQPRLVGELSFDYDGTIVTPEQAGSRVYQPDRRHLVRRDPAAENAAAAQLEQLGFRRERYTPNPALELAPRNLPKVVRTLLQAGWHVEAEGKVFRRPGEFNLSVSSGIDWFDLEGGVNFDGQVASLPDLLAALRRGDNAVQLGDGTFGLLPEEWLKKYGQLAGLGKAEEGKLRFRRSQVGLLDALLAAQPEISFDETFARFRDELNQFGGIEPVDAPAGFVGELRGYQREGLGWLGFLQRFGFGGCLADDMGLGKTIQVLALLESRREQHAGPSLVVVPRSLVFNWKAEAARFTPQLKVLDHTGMGRAKPGAHFQEHDVVLTTYGTLRRDIVDLKDIAFDYCILDEAQAAKNASSQTAKAVRLLQGKNRLALSGTPVENHLGELWSLFEFLNPGMLGVASVFQGADGGLRNPDEQTRTLLARALRPFILRRTKRQVATDLPEKTEQTLYCELEPDQRKLYDELKQHYRQALLPRVERDGIGRSKIQILEALLRLRQAACHPGLIDKKRTDEPSAKLESLLPQLGEVTEEGHKTLVFSQFTSFLAIVRQRLDREKVAYEYLDGRTRDRAARVERFQNDPECKLFLISLKAGGLGLNLTAAEYVFLLDPWWNPAVEAQAIDRAHRIGQTNQVFAYRLIARDTVEEKVLQLQQTKRNLADAIINADNSLIRDLGREDLELLLS